MGHFGFLIQHEQVENRNRMYGQVIASSLRYCMTRRTIHPAVTDLRLSVGVRLRLARYPIWSLHSIADAWSGSRGQT